MVTLMRLVADILVILLLAGILAALLPFAVQMMSEGRLRMVMQHEQHVLCQSRGPTRGELEKLK